MGYWLKLYTDILDDPKYFKLSKEARLGMYELLLVAKKIENGELTGQLPCIEDIAFYTRRSVEEWQKVIPELVSVGVISDGDQPVIKNYTKRQDAIPNDERYKQYKKKRNANGMQRKPTKSVGEVETEVDVETDTETEVDVEKSDKSDDNNPLITTFIQHTHLEPGAEAPQIALDLQNAGVIQTDIVNAIHFLNNKPEMKCVSFRSIRNPAIIEMQRRTAKEKKDAEEDQYAPVFNHAEIDPVIQKELNQKFGIRE